MEKLNEKIVEQIMLQEIEDFIDMNGIDIEEIKTVDDLLEALDGFQSGIFLEYEEQENKELMWSIYLNEDNTPGIEIVEL